MDDPLTWPQSCIIYVGIMSDSILTDQYQASEHHFKLLSSTHNTQIERMWVEVGWQFCWGWRAFFSQLEWLHHLDCKDPHHLWLVHVLFLDSINEDCQSFLEEWNAKPISGPATNDQSPNVILSMLCCLL